MIHLKIRDTRGTPKERPRFNFKTHRTYTPAKTQAYEKKIEREFNKWYSEEDCYQEDPVTFKIICHYKVPKSKSKKDREYLLFRRAYMQRPDVDNLAKAILDALNGLAYRDDNQVVRLEVEKIYDENEDYVEIIIDKWRNTYDDL